MYVYLMKNVKLQIKKKKKKKKEHFEAVTFQKNVQVQKNLPST